MTDLLNNDGTPHVCRDGCDNWLSKAGAQHREAEQHTGSVYVALAIRSVDGDPRGERVLAAGTDPHEVIERIGGPSPTRALLTSLGWSVVLDRYTKDGTRETVARESQRGGLLRMSR